MLQCQLQHPEKCISEMFVKIGIRVTPPDFIKNILLLIINEMRQQICKRRKKELKILFETNELHLFL